MARRRGLTAVPVSHGRDAVVTMCMDRDVSDKSDSLVISFILDLLVILLQLKLAFSMYVWKESLNNSCVLLFSF